MQFNLKADRNESGTMAKGRVGAARVTAMLLQDEAHLSASSKISTELAHSQSTIHCSEERLSLPDDNAAGECVRYSTHGGMTN